MPRSPRKTAAARSVQRPKVEAEKLIQRDSHLAGGEQELPTVMWVIADSRETVATLLIAGQQAHSKKPRAKEVNKLLEQIAALKLLTLSISDLEEGF